MLFNRRHEEPTLIIIIMITYILLISFTNQSLIPNENGPIQFYGELMTHFHKAVLDIIANTTSLTSSCRKTLFEAYSDSDSLYLTKLLTDSSHNIKDLGSFQKCKNDIYYSTINPTKSSKPIMNKLKFIYFHIPEKSFCDNSLLGGCIIEGCDIKEYKQLLQFFGEKIPFMDKDCLNEAVVYETDQKFTLTNSFFIGVVPLVLFIIIVIFDFFPKIPRFLFRCCFKKKKKSYGSLYVSDNNRKSEGELIQGQNNTFIESTFQDTKMSISFIKSSKNYDINGLSQLKRCFKLKGNFSELMLSDISLHESKTNNESGISFTKGFRGICLTMYTVGLTFQSIYQSPMRDFSEKGFTSTYLSFLYFINKYSSNMLLAISGFTLCYKMICYLDSEVETIELKEEDFISTINDTNDNSTTKSKTIQSKEVSKSSPFLSSLNKANNINIDFTINDKSNSKDDLNQLDSYLLFNTFNASSSLYQKIQVKSLMKFIFYQFYKYFLFVSIVLFAKYTYYEICLLLSYKNSLSDFVKQSFIDKASIMYILGQIFLFRPFFPSFDEGSQLIYEPFELVILEISLFLLFSLVIFYSYKKNWRLDIICIVLLSTFCCLKFAFFYIQYIILFPKKYSIISTFYPIKDFIQSQWTFLRINPLYRANPFIIGIFFGLINYTIQKSTSDFSTNSSRKYLILPLRFTSYLTRYQTLKLIIFTFIFFLFFIWEGFAYKVLYFLANHFSDSSELLSNFTENLFCNIYYLYDIEIMVFLTFLAILPYTLIGENPIIYFLRSNYWNILSRPYFTYILLIWGLINNILFQTDRRIRVSLNNILHYSIVNMMLAILFCDTFFAFFEMPLKKLNKLILKKRTKRKKSGDNKNL